MNPWLNNAMMSRGENMKDIPFFTTEYGVASLALTQIPYRQTAYIQVQTLREGSLQELIAECAGFCRAAGAEKIFWAAAGVLDVPHSCIVEMRGASKPKADMVASLFPVTGQTVTQWRQIHNDRMAAVDHARYLTAADEPELLSSQTYFIHNGETLLGIGWLTDDTIRAIASVQPGAGERVLHTMMSLVPDRTLRLEVASTNRKAIALYERSGFLCTNNIKTWHKY